LSIKKSHKNQITDHKQIPEGYYLVAITGGATKSSLVKSVFQALMAGGSTYGLDHTDYWVLVFDQNNLLGAFFTGDIWEAAQDYFKDVCADVRSRTEEELRDKYFYDAPEEVERKNRHLMDLEWLESNLIEPGGAERDG
jgi:hypothetical protein